MVRRLPLVLALAAVPTAARADTFHVTTSGSDAADRDGRTAATAWASLAHACDRVPAGAHTIQIGPGTFTATRTATPKSGVTIQGSGAHGTTATRIVASREWKLTDQIEEGNRDYDPAYLTEYLIAFRRAENVTVRALELASPADRPITGAIYCRDGKNVVLEDLAVCHFRWNGLRIEFSERVTVRNCYLQDASSQKKGNVEGGHVRTRWLTDCRFHNNVIVSTTGKGYGYKGGGHVRCRIDHNAVAVGYFAVESAHENEYGVEIDHNHFDSCISVPKSGQGQDPAARGAEYTFWIHHNVLTDSYTVEGPRNHLRLSHNHVRIARTGGRVYTHHGGINHGPVWIDHNVIENVDRALVWMNGGLAENVTFAHNTVTCADAGDRTGKLFDSYTAERLNGWVVLNNVFRAPATKPRGLFPDARGVPSKIRAAGNLFEHVTGPAEGNFAGRAPGLAEDGARPWAFFRPAGKDSFVVDRGVELPRPFWIGEWSFRGAAPDLGAVELGDDPPAWADVPGPAARRKE